MSGVKKKKDYEEEKSENERRKKRKIGLKKMGSRKDTGKYTQQG